MSKTLDVSVLVRLVDKLTAPLTAMQRKFGELAKLGQKIGVLGTAVAAISFAGPMQSAAAFDQVLRDSVVTAGLFATGAEARIAVLAKSYQDLAVKTGIASEDIAKAGGYLVAAGMDDSQVEALIPTLMRVSKAASAVPLDVAKVGFALSNTLKISSADMELAMAKLVTAGKLGRFEFKDMAKELPEISAQFSKFGITGVKAVEAIGASLQIAMFGTDSTSSAANNFKNFLTKILSPETIKNFKKMGVDITGVMKDAAAKGINPVEAAIQKVAKLTGVSTDEMTKFYKAHKAAGMSDAEAAKAVVEQLKKIGGAEKLGGLFADMQVLDFLLPMLANIEKYKEFKKEIANSGVDVIAKDFETQMAGLTTQLFMFTEIATQFGRRVGLAFAKNLPWLNTGLMTVLGWVARIDKDFPGAIDMVLTIGGGFLVLVAALGLLAPVFSIISAAFGVLAAVIGALASPLVLLAAALAAIAVIIINDWANFAPMFRAIGTGIMTVVRGWVAYIKALFSGDWTGMKAGIQTMVSGLSNIGSNVLAVLQRVGAIIIDWLDNQLGTDIRAWPGKVATALSGAADAVVGALKTAWSGAGAVLKFMWDENLKQVEAAFTDFTTWMDGWTGGAFSAALGKVSAAWDGVKTAATSAFDGIKSAWKSVVDYIASLVPSIPDPLAWIKRTYGGEAPAAGAPMPATDPTGAATGGAPAAPGKQSWLPADKGFTAPVQAASATAGKAEVGGTITVAAAEGTRITNVQSNNPAVPMVADRGTVIGRA